MIRWVIFFLLFSTTVSWAQPYNRLVRVNTGISSEQFDHMGIQNTINDTGAIKMEFVSWSPTLSYTHEVVFGQILSVSGSIGFQYMNLFYGHQHYGGSYFYTSINPQLVLFNRKKFEYYIKLRVGASFYIHNTEIIPDPVHDFLPRTVNMFTGVTLGGFNYFINERIGLNLELSIWSPEMATFGISYRFFKGELPKIQSYENEKPQEPRIEP